MEAVAVAGGGEVGGRAQRVLWQDKAPAPDVVGFLAWDLPLIFQGRAVSTPGVSQ